MQAAVYQQVVRQDASRIMRGHRRGVAAVEFAVCAPLVLLLTAGAIQMIDAISLKNSLRVAAYEAARVAILPDADTSQTRQRAREVLAARNVNDAVIAFDPSDVSHATSGNPIRVRIGAPASSNSILPDWFFGNRTIRVEFVMLRE